MADLHTYNVRMRPPAVWLMKSWHGFLGTLLLFLQLGNLCLPRGVALCCVPTPQHVLEYNFI